MPEALQASLIVQVGRCMKGISTDGFGLSLVGSGGVEGGGQLKRSGSSSGIIMASQAAAIRALHGRSRTPMTVLHARAATFPLAWVGLRTDASIHDTARLAAS